jgi:hypothetical protein
MALYTLESASGNTERAHREAIVIAYLTLQMLKLTYPQKNVTKVFEALQEAEGVMDLLARPKGVV